MEKLSNSTTAYEEGIVGAVQDIRNDQIQAEFLPVFEVSEQVGTVDRDGQLWRFVGKDGKSLLHGHHG